MDVVGPLVPSRSGNVKLLTIVDVFTRYPIAIPIPNETAETVARSLQRHLFSIHGYPTLLLSDRAQGFVSKGLRWMCARRGIAKVNTTGLSPTAALEEAFDTSGSNRWRWWMRTFGGSWG